MTILLVLWASFPRDYDIYCRWKYRIPWSHQQRISLHQHSFVGSVSGSPTDTSQETEGRDNDVAPDGTQIGKSWITHDPHPILTYNRLSDWVMCALKLIWKSEILSHTRKEDANECRRRRGMFMDDYRSDGDVISDILPLKRIRKRYLLVFSSFNTFVYHVVRQKRILLCEGVTDVWLVCDHSILSDEKGIEWHNSLSSSLWNFIHLNERTHNCQSRCSSFVWDVFTKTHSEEKRTHHPKWSAIWMGHLSKHQQSHATVGSSQSAGVTGRSTHRNVPWCALESDRWMQMMMRRKTDSVTFDFKETKGSDDKNSFLFSLNQHTSHPNQMHRKMFKSWTVQ